MALPARPARAAGLLAGIAYATLLATTLRSANPDWLRQRARDLVEMEIREPPPPARPEPEKARPPEPPPPRPVPRRLVARLPEAPPPQAPPPANQEPPKEPPKSAPPVFGVTMSSVVNGEAAMAVPVGNTLMTKDRTRPPSDAPAAPLGAAPGPRPFVPVADIYVATMPVVLKEVKGEDTYPPEARKLGFEGAVKVRVEIDEAGNVHGARVVESAGHGFDEVAVRALKQFKFSPARTADGRSVPVVLNYLYRFELPR